MRYRWPWFCLLLAITHCGGSSTSPTPFGVITTIRYDRVYPPSDDNAGHMLINVSLPAEKSIPFCMPVQQSATTFVCDSLNWEVDEGEDAVIWINDPVLNRGVATTLLVNGVRVTRIEFLPNGSEMGHLRWTKSRGFE